MCVRMQINKWKMSLVIYFCPHSNRTQRIKYNNKVIAIRLWYSSETILSQMTERIFNLYGKVFAMAEMCERIELCQCVSDSAFCLFHLEIYAI